MTRRMFRAIAAIVAQIEDPTARESATYAAVRECSRGSERFDSGRFRAACDSERTLVVASRVVAKARGSKVPS
jgi:hypothetical protein